MLIFSSFLGKVLMVGLTLSLVSSPIEMSQPGESAHDVVKALLLVIRRVFPAVLYYRDVFLSNQWVRVAVAAGG